MEEIRKITVDEVFNSFYNNLLNKYVSSVIDARYFESFEPEERVGFRQGPSMGNNSIPTNVEIKAKEAVKQKREEAENNLKLLKAIEATRKELKDFKI